MPRYKLTLSYDGTRYCGWQTQPNQEAIQDLIQKSLSILYKKPITITGSGRTDSGVHAIGQVAHFEAETPVILQQLNGLLPPDIRAHKLDLAPNSFHARKSAIKKTYRYYISMEQSAFLFPYSAYEPRLDIDLICEASKKFIGTKDFTSFANTHSKAPIANKIRTIFSIDVRKKNQLVELSFIGSGFLYKQVRNIVGCLIYISKKQLKIEEILSLIEARDRRQAPPPAKARGLFLANVHYECPFASIEEKDSKCHEPLFFSSIFAK